MPTTLETLADQLLPILHRYGVLRAGIFGSYAREETHTGSDLDLLVELPPGSSLLDLVGLQMDLADALGISVDANTYSALHPLIRDQVLGDQVRVL